MTRCSRPRWPREIGADGRHGEAAPADQAERAGGDGTRSPAPAAGRHRGFRLLALRARARRPRRRAGRGRLRPHPHQPRLEHRVGRLYHGRRRGRSAPSVASGAESAGHTTRPPRGPPRQRRCRGGSRGASPSWPASGTSPRPTSRSRSRTELLVPAGPPHANPDSAATRLRSQAGRRPDGGAGRERPFRGQAGDPRRGPHRRGRTPPG